MKRIELTPKQIEFLLQKGFHRNDSVHSGFYMFEKTDLNYEIWVLINGFENERFSKYEFKFDVLTYDDPEQGEQMYTEYIEYEQSFEDFINKYID